MYIKLDILLLTTHLITANEIWPREVAEIVANELEIEFISDGKLRQRRDASCADTNAACPQYKVYCTNPQFKETCRLSCKVCEVGAAITSTTTRTTTTRTTTTTSTTTRPEVTTAAVLNQNTGDCVDKYTYCPNMSVFCKNEAYKGVRTYCRKTCQNCGTPSTRIPATATPASDSSCKDKSFCANLPNCHEMESVRSKFLAHCPLSCRDISCKSIWFVAPTKIIATSPAALGPTTINPFTTPKPCSDKSKQCSKLSKNCKDPAYKSAMEKYCQRTCNFCENAQNQCQDKVDNCQSLLHYCKADSTKAMMEVQCPLSCGFCSNGETRPVPITTVVPATPAHDPNCMDAEGYQCNLYTAHCKNFNTKVPEVCRKTCDNCNPITTTTQPIKMIAYNHWGEWNACSTSCVGGSQSRERTCNTGVQAHCDILGEPSMTQSCNTHVSCADAVAVDDNCVDTKPAYCAKAKRYCKNPKYKKTLVKVCAKTCSFCPAGSPSVAPSTNEAVSDALKYGKWSLWSRCSPKCTQYKARKCLIQPCSPADIRITQQCPAAKYPRIAACQVSTPTVASTPATTPAVAPVCKNNGGAAFCAKYKRYCNHQKYKKTLEAKCKKTCAYCT